MSATSVFDVSSCMARFSLFSRLFFFFHTCQGFDGKYFITSLAFFSHSIVVDDDEQSLCAFI